MIKVLEKEEKPFATMKQIYWHLDHLTDFSKKNIEKLQKIEDMLDELCPYCKKG